MLNTCTNIFDVSKSADYRIRITGQSLRDWKPPLEAMGNKLVIGIEAHA